MEHSLCPVAKRGRPKGKPLTARERAQRRAAPIKTGQYAETALAQAAPPCKQSTCLASYPCEVKEEIERRGSGVAVCIPALADDDAIRRYLRAIQSGDLDGIQEIAATSLGLKAAMHQRELLKLANEGLTYEAPIVGHGEGGPEIIGTKTVPNPRAELVLKIGEHLGHTAPDQVLTPKSGAVAAANRGIEQLGKAAWINGMRNRLAGDGEEEAA